MSGAGWHEHEWEDEIDMRGLEEIPEGWKMIETYIDRVDGFVRMTVTEGGRVVYAARYKPEVAYIMAQTLTMNAMRIEDENA